MDDKRKLSQEIFNPVSDSVQKLAQLFPSAVKDGEVDFNALKKELGQFAPVGAEKYELNWAGKANAKRVAREDVLGRTLNYVPQDSKNADTTENLYIEGDNLEVLKLLRQNYYGAVKMIYIDPPYNTGNDFVYRDNFTMSEAESAEAEGETVDGERMVVNQKSTNRYHANWLNMMYPRLKIARDLLTEDGAIFISIDDNEVDNLMEMCDEVFGEDNFVGCITRVAKTTSFRGDFLAPSKDYLLCYAKSIASLCRFSDDVDNTQFKKIETEGERKGEYYRDDIAFYLSTLETRPNQRYFIECPDGQKVVPPGKTFPPEKPQEGDGVWRWNLDSFNIKRDLIVFKKTNRSPLIDENGNQANWNLYTKSYLNDKLENGNIPRDFFEKFLNRNGSEELKRLNIPFPFPKPSKLIQYLLKITQTDKDAIVLDFFSGSATTAHAVMQLNAEDGGNRKFIMAQLPEACDEKSEAYKAGYKNICEIGKERIRRAGEKIKADIEEQNAQLKLGEEPKQVPDIGFKVFRTAGTNIRWTHEALKTGQIHVEESMLSYKDKLDFMPGFKDLDVVYEVLLRQRDVPLSAKVEKRNKIGKRTYLIADAYLVCLEESITKDMLEKLAAVEPLPIKYILRDSAFEDNISLKDETIRRLEALIARNAGENEQTYTVEFI